MAATPTVTIKVGGIPVSVATTPIPESSTNLEDSLYMLYVQATHGEERRQWIVFPPAVDGFGIAPSEVRENRVLVLSRTQKFVGNRSKWFTGFLYEPFDGLPTELSNFLARGYELGGVVVAPLEVDDYMSVYARTTSHKAIRAIDRVLTAVHDITVK